jgi:hypothetical protein
MDRESLQIKGSSLKDKPPLCRARVWIKLELIKDFYEQYYFGKKQSRFEI